MVTTDAIAEARRRPLRCRHLLVWLALAVSARAEVSDGHYFMPLAGGPVPGCCDGCGAAARFHRPAGVAMDRHGRLVVADSMNNTIRRITPAGEVTTLAGSPGVAGSADGTGRAANFFHPSGLAIDADDCIYVADAENATIRRVSPAGEVVTLAGTAGTRGNEDGFGARARFVRPTGVAVGPAGMLFVADPGNETVRQVTPAGAVTTVARLPGLGPRAVAIEPSGGLLVAGGSAIFRVDAAGTARILARGVFGALDGLAVDSFGWVYAADRDHDAVLRLSPDGIFLESEFAPVRRPAGLALVARGGLVVTTEDNVVGMIHLLPAVASADPAAIGSTGAKNRGD